MRMGLFITRRLASRILLVVTVFFGLIFLSEMLNTGRFVRLSENVNTMTAFLVPIYAAAHWSIKGLPVTVLIGGIAALLDLQSHRELLVIKASGVSVWRLLILPITTLVAAGFLVTLLLDGPVTAANRVYNPTPNMSSAGSLAGGEVWLDQQSEGIRYVMHGQRDGDAARLRQVTIYLFAAENDVQIEAKRATLQNGHWIIESARRLTGTGPGETYPRMILATDSSPAEIVLKLGPMEDFTLSELTRALGQGIADPRTRAGAQTRFARLMSMPFLLVGSLLIAFAFTAGYRRTGTYGAMILYGIILGFVVFVITEMAERAGSAGVLDPAFAAWGPVVVSIVIGVTVLLRKEDGRA